MSQLLHNGWRFGLGLVGFLLLGGATYLYFKAPSRHAKEATTAETQEPPGTVKSRTTQTKETNAATDPISLSLALLTSGFLFLVIAANGLKIAKVSKDGVEFVPPDPKKVAQDEAKATQLTAFAPSDAPAFAHLPVSKFVKGNIEYEVFAPADVPAAVLNAAATQLKQSLAARDLEYACRKHIPGGQVWLLKHRSGNTLSIPFQ